ncbi:MAG: ABC transporter ATP-binding protein [Candidatus Kapabacteria bacterium]|nr:ABC transporter ATP-binding protein [Candidatus Kapabacteria bacterium]
MNARLDVIGLSKRYARRLVVDRIDLQASSGQVIGIVGANGSGKSTLVKMIAGLLRPDAGTITLSMADGIVSAQLMHEHCGLVAPYLQIYDEFTPVEHLHLHARLHGRTLDASRVEEVLSLVGLDAATTRIIRSFSSGMRQRMSIALAVSLMPPLLLLDEPGVTLDEAGRQTLSRCIDIARANGSIVILATNDDRERSLCDRVVVMTDDRSVVS